MVLALRVFGKRELSQLNSADIVLILLISNSVQNAMVGSNTSLEGGILAALALFVINYLFKRWINQSKTVKDWVLSKPQVLIHNGNVEFKALAKLGITSEVFISIRYTRGRR